MESSNNHEPNDYDEVDIAKTKPDSFQSYVFLAHIIIAIMISAVSFTGGHRLWFTGTGLVTPILLVIASYFYSLITGINWYREELIPYMFRTITIQQFEVERFLAYKRLNRSVPLIAGYLATVVCQLVWFQIADIVATFIEHVSATGDVLYYALFAMIILFLLIMGFFTVIFLHVLNFMFSDIRQFIEFDEKIQKILKDKEKEAKEQERKRKDSSTLA